MLYDINVEYQESGGLKKTMIINRAKFQKNTGITHKKIKKKRLEKNSFSDFEPKEKIQISFPTQEKVKKANSVNIASVSPSAEKKQTHAVPVNIAIDFDDLSVHSFTGMTLKSNLPGLVEPDEFWIAGDSGRSYSFGSIITAGVNIKNTGPSEIKEQATQFKEISDRSPGNRPILGGELFEWVQTGEIFPDSKTFVDAVPRVKADDIEARFKEEKDRPDFDLKKFITHNFTLPEASEKKLSLPPGLSMESHIDHLWNFLGREPDKVSEADSLIPLKHPYIVPGGRFREIYYWDSYFTAEGLAESGKMDMVENMTQNFADIIDKYGHIPNGNRKYYLSRSQPPLFACMVDLIAKKKGIGEALKFLPQVEKEYAYWMDGADKLTEENPEYGRAVRLEDGSVLNRFWDDKAEPREESYKEDLELCEGMTKAEKEKRYRNLRAGGESGWDFTSRWFKDPKDIGTIRTTEVIPVDLNAELYNMEMKLSEWNEAKGDKVKAEKYRDAAEARKKAVQKNCWDEEKGFFFDYCATDKEKTGTWSLAASYPLFYVIATQEQADRVATHLKNRFLKTGGLVTTLTEGSGQQWDSPNGWAPLQFASAKGLENYGHKELANEIKKKFTDMTRHIYQKTGKMLEKYNVCNPDEPGGGGEYELQEGFGWTNGVTIKFLKEQEKQKDIDEIIEQGGIPLSL